MQYKRIYVEITNICNKNCSFCSKDSKPKREMTINEFEHIVKEIKPYTNYIYLHVKGEPLIHSQLNEILSLTSQYNFKVNITTNGTLLNKQKEILGKYNNIKQINISLHSFKEDEYISNIINAVEYLDNGSRSILYRFWALENNELNKDNKKILDQLNQHYNFTDDIKTKIENDTNIKIQNNIYINKNKLFVWPSLNNQFVSKKGYCQGLKTHIAILADGTVVPCCLDSSGIINLGNIYETPLNEILTSNKTQTIKKNFEQRIVCEELCQKCSYRDKWKEK